MSRLIDADALKADYGMADECKDCRTPVKECEYDRVYTKMDFCSWLDDAPTVPDSCPSCLRQGCQYRDGTVRINCPLWKECAV